MGFAQVFLVITFAYWSCAEDPIITREYVWTNYKAFKDFGWIESVPGTTRVYEAPSEMNAKLYELNKNYTGNVWGWTGRHLQRTNKYDLFFGHKPEFCGMINATVSFKYYLEGLGERTYYHPSCTSWSGKQWRNVCSYGNSVFPVWSYITYQAKLTGLEWESFFFSAYLSAAGLYLVDEVRLTYTVKQGVKCPFSCTHDCEYRGIDCHNYYTCIDRMYKEFHSCSKEDGLAFNPITKSCDFKENVPGCNVTEPPPPPHCVCEYRPHYDCSQYYYCPDTCHPEQCEVRQCPLGLLWTTDASGDGSGHQQCVLSSKASCYNETMSTTPEWWVSSTSANPSTDLTLPSTESTPATMESTTTEATTQTMESTTTKSTPPAMESTTLETTTPTMELPTTESTTPTTESTTPTIKSTKPTTTESTEPKMGSTPPTMASNSLTMSWDGVGTITNKTLHVMD